MKALLLPWLAVSFLLASCSGGGGGDPGPSPGPPPPGTSLTVTLAATGLMPPNAPSAAVSGFRVVDSLAQLDQLQVASYTVPQELRTLDFTQNAVMYLEGPADDDLGAAVRLVEIRRLDGTRDEVRAERCTGDPNAIPTPRAQRAQAYYVIPKLTSSVTYSWSAGCTTLTPLTATLVAVGDANVGGPWPPIGSRVIRTQAEWDALKAFLPPGAIAPAFATPDFNALTLLYVQADGDWDVTSYVRVARVYRNADGTHEVLAEYCGNDITGVPIHIAHAVYAVPRFTGVARFVIASHEPGTCATAR